MKKVICKWGWEYDCEITHFVDARPPPICQDPDSPAYSDQGDEGELEFEVLSIMPDETDPDYDMIMSYDELEQDLWECRNEF